MSITIIFIICQIVTASTFFIMGMIYGLTYSKRFYGGLLDEKMDQIISNLKK